MRVAIVRSAEPGCEPDCPEWIAAQGQIRGDTPRQLKAILRRLGGRKLPIFIHSSGGEVEASFAMGRQIRAKGLDVAVAKTAFVPCAPRDAACRKGRDDKPRLGLLDQSFSMCASACAFVLAAGARRVVDPQAVVGVHQILLRQTFNKVLHTYRVTVTPSMWGPPKVSRKLINTKLVSQKVVSKKAPLSTYARAEDYFREMGIDEKIMPLLQQTPHEQVHWLTPGELWATGMVTHRINAAQLLASKGAEVNGRSLSGDSGLSGEPPPCQHFGGIGLGCSPAILPPGGGAALAPDALIQ
jgi:hypothetical protein